MGGFGLGCKQREIKEKAGKRLRREGRRSCLDGFQADFSCGLVLEGFFFCLANGGGRLDVMQDCPRESWSLADVTPGLAGRLGNWPFVRVLSWKMPSNTHCLGDRTVLVSISLWHNFFSVLHFLVRGVESGS